MIDSEDIVDLAKAVLATCGWNDRGDMVCRHCNIMYNYHRRHESGCVVNIAKLILEDVK